MATTRIPSEHPPASFDLGQFAGQGRPSAKRSDERRLRQVSFVLTDLIVIWLSASVSFFLRFSGILFRSTAPSPYPGKNFWEHAGVLLLYSGLIVLFCNTRRLYSASPEQSASEESWDIVKAVGLATALQLGCLYVARLRAISSFVILLTMLGSMLAMVAWRRLRRRRLQSRVGMDCRNVLIIGQGSQAHALYDELKANPQFGYVLKGMLGYSEGQLFRPESAQILGSLEHLRSTLRANFIDEIFVCHPDREIVKRVADEAQLCGLGVHIIPDLYDGLAFRAPVEYLGRFPTLYLPHHSKPVLELMIKRWLDLVCSVLALLSTLPIMLVIAILIKLDSPGPVIYASTRIGRKGRTFRCYKFRTMLKNAEAMKAHLQHLNERDEILFKIANDPRITRVGRVLRKYSLDELPQFWNVLKGDMSMVGPRPPLADEVKKYELQHLRRLDVLPGITGLWQVESRTNPSFASYISLDVQYVERWHLLMDLKILFKTISVVFAGSGH